MVLVANGESGVRVKLLRYYSDSRYGGFYSDPRIHLNADLDQLDNFYTEYLLFLMKLHENVQSNSTPLLLPFPDD